MDNQDSLPLLILLILGAVAYAVAKRIYNSAENKGIRGESEIATILYRAINNGLYGFVLQNVYVPKADGGTTEVDTILVCTNGIYVLESKNFFGWIFGDDTHKYWTVTLYAGKNWLGLKRTEKHRFYNPIWQNETHVNCIRRIVGSEIPITSVIVFSNRSEFKKVVNNSNSLIMHTSEFRHFAKGIRTTQSDRLSVNRVNDIYARLSNFRDLSGEKKQSHIRYINEQRKNISTCPRCGGKLVVRTARKGANAGSQFLGCENYPKCKYTKDIV